MLRIPLLHPQILAALAGAGHGSTVLVADANFPLATASNPRATLVQLNLSPGRVGALEVLQALCSVAEFEAATVMRTADGIPAPIVADFAAQLPGLAIAEKERHDFYRAAGEPTLALAIATGETQLYANLLLTIGALAPAET